MNLHGSADFEKIRWAGSTAGPSSLIAQEVRWCRIPFATSRFHKVRPVIFILVFPYWIFVLGFSFLDLHFGVRGYREEFGRRWSPF